MDSDRIAQLQEMTHRPGTPGDFLLDLLDEMGISQRSLAARMGISAQTLSELTRNRRSLSADMAIRLGRVFNTSAAVWMTMQRNVDLWDVLHADISKYAAIKPLVDTEPLTKA